MALDGVPAAPYVKNTDGRVSRGASSSGSEPLIKVREAGRGRPQSNHGGSRPDKGDTLQVRANVNNGDVAKATTVRGKVFEKSLVVGVEGEPEDHKAIRPTQDTCCQVPGLL